MALVVMGPEQAYSPSAKVLVREEGRAELLGHPYARRIISISSLSFCSDTFCPRFWEPGFSGFSLN